ncbi:MAG: class I SAM-dependent methyltransferase [Anaerolineae bacterium]|nr:class I SAM-dependent methyltransferase [Anaerolineae bacterium]
MTLTLDHPLTGQAAQPAPAHPYTEADIGRTEMTPTYRVDLRPDAADVFYDANPINDWRELTWDKIGRPYRVERWSEDKKQWEKEHDQALPVKTAWEMFNRSFQSLFDTVPSAAKQEALGKLGKAAGQLDMHEAWEAVEEAIQWMFWNKIHRVEDAVWDPRGKRALFGGLDVEKPNILFLGAADGYEAMQLMAMYPGGHAVLVDYDDYCRTDRFGNFPEAYPFLGYNPSTGQPKVWYRDQMDIDFEVEDIRNLKYGKEFDLVVSIGLIEHFPDQYKPEAFDMHRRFLKPGGTAIITTPRVQLRTKLFYTVFADIMNFAYRELMDVTHLGLYAYENGFEIMRHGRIKAHNGLICRPR